MRAAGSASAVFLLAAILAALPSGSAAAAEARPYRIAGAEATETKEWRPVDVLELSRNGVSCEMRYLDPEARRATLRSSLGTTMDLFPGRTGEKENERPGYLVFVLQITNNSTERLEFNPGQVRLATEKGDMKFALDYSAIYERMQAAGPDAPDMNEMSKVVFERTITIVQGGSARKLLVFDAPRDDKYKTLAVRVLELNVGTEGVDLIFPFRKFFE